METRPQNQNEQQLATKNISHSQFHSFAPLLDHWQVADIKSQERPETARTSNEKQQRATEDQNEHHGWKTKPGNKKPKRATKCKQTTIENEA